MTKTKRTYIFISLCMVFSSLSYQRNMAWKGDIEFWRQAVERSPHKGRTHLNLGGAYYDIKLYDEALREYETAMRLSPDSPEVYNNLGNLYVFQKEMDKALKEYLRAIAINPNFAPAYINAGFIIADRGGYKEAARMYEKGLSINPGLANGHYGLAMIYETTGEKGLALSHWQEYLKLASGQPESDMFVKNAMRHLDRLR